MRSIAILVFAGLLAAVTDTVHATGSHGDYGVNSHRHYQQFEHREHYRHRHQSQRRFSHQHPRVVVIGGQARALAGAGPERHTSRPAHIIRTENRYALDRLRPRTLQVQPRRDLRHGGVIHRGGGIYGSAIYGGSRGFILRF